MSIAVRTETSIWTPKTDRSEVLHLPLWRPNIGGNPATFRSFDKYGHVCTLSGTTWGYRGRAFDGIDDIITVPHHANLSLATAFTVQIWANCNTSAAYRWFICKAVVGASFVQNYGIIILDNNAIYGTVGKSDGVNNWGSYFPSPNAGGAGWHLYTMAFDTISLILYTDTTAGTPTATSGEAFTDAGNVILGRVYTIAYSGSMGEAKIHNRKLTASEIVRFHQLTKWRYK